MLLLNDEERAAHYLRKLPCGFKGVSLHRYVQVLALPAKNRVSYEAAHDKRRVLA